MSRSSAKYHAAEVRRRLHASWAPDFRTTVNASNPAVALRLEGESLQAFRLTRAERLGALQLVQDTETGWLGLACGVPS